MCDELFWYYIELNAVKKIAYFVCLIYFCLMMNIFIFNMSTICKKKIVDGVYI